MTAPGAGGRGVTWVNVVASTADECRHAESFDRHTSRRTRCGREVAEGRSPAGPACHVCLPDEAHPLASVWELCRRWDDRANAGLRDAS